MKFGYVLRVDLRSGLHLEFGYDTAADAEKWHAELHDVLDDGLDLVNIQDGMGHASFIVGSQIAHLGVCDIAAEVAGRVGQGLIAQEAEKRALAAHQRGSVLVPRPSVIGADGRPLVNGGH